ncbi:transporter substrate-binding domain-containing protein [Psychromonas sp.]|nr:transporter substrate-binding domain-containing protein [Psychromonas sp.]
MKSISSIFTIVMFALLSVTTLSLPAIAQDTITTINKDKLIVGMAGEQPPYNFSTIQGTVIGYDVDLATYLATAMNRELEITLMPFADLIPTLEAGKVDVVLSALAITQQRKEKVLFTTSYGLAGKTILTTKKNMKRIHQTTGFNNDDVKLVALKGSTSAELAKNRLAKAQLTTIDHYEDGVLAILSGEADGMVADLSICELIVYRDNTNELAILKRPIGSEEIGIALPKGSESLQKEINQHLITFASENGIEELHQKWFLDASWLPLVP